jgi:quinol-cytochrome oxidoreductase complex cytochrome b subunit
MHARQPESAVAQMALAERLWRRGHLVLALLFVAGLAAHLVTVLFFAGYVADGREVYWWHFAG